MEGSDISQQLVNIRQVMAIHNLQHSIAFGPQDFSTTQMPHKDPLVITLKIANCLVERILVDRCSTVEIMSYSAFRQIELLDEEILPMATPLVGFDRTSMVPMGTVRPEVAAGKRLLMVEFVAVNAVSPYNVIMGRGWIHTMKGIPSTLHQVMRYVT